jgi:hypothetical protein
VTKIEADTVTITHSTGVAHIRIILLPPDMQKQLNYDPQAATTSPIADSAFKKLVLADGTNWNTSAPIQYYALFYSAGWCPTSCTYAPTLVQWYKGFKPLHPNFELIFVSGDKSETEMFSFMKSVAMPWPAISFGDLQD